MIPDLADVVEECGEVTECEMMSLTMTKVILEVANSSGSSYQF